MTAEVVSWVTLWKWSAGIMASVAAFFGINWVHNVQQKLKQCVTREELTEHLDRVLSVVQAEADKSRAEVEKLILEETGELKLKIERLKK